MGVGTVFIDRVDTVLINSQISSVQLYIEENFNRVTITRVKFIEEMIQTNHFIKSFINFHYVISNEFHYL